MRAIRLIRARNTIEVPGLLAIFVHKLIFGSFDLPFPTSVVSFLKVLYKNINGGSDLPAPASAVMFLKLCIWLIVMLHESVMRCLYYVSISGVNDTNRLTTLTSRVITCPTERPQARPPPLLKGWQDHYWAGLM